MNMAVTGARLGALALLLWSSPTGGVLRGVEPSYASSSARWVDPEDIVARTNAERLASGRPPLVASDRLTRAALIHARQMADARVLSHELSGAEYPTLLHRARAVGYQYTWIAENIAHGYPTAEHVMAGWMNSAPHRENILSTRMVEIGVAVAYARDGTAYYASLFGRPRP